MEKKELTYQDLIDECQNLRKELNKYRWDQEAQELSAANLESLINNQESSIWSIDSNYCYVIFNDFFKTAYYYSFGIELKKGLNALEILKSRPDLYHLWKKKYDEALSGQHLNFEFIIHQNSEDKTFNIALNPVIVNNKVTGVTALSHEVTSQKKAAKALKDSNTNMLAIMENTLESIWAINPSYEILFTNSVFKDEFYKSFGVKLEKGVNLLESLPPPLQPIWKKRYDRALSNERFSFIDEIDIGSKIVYVEVSMNPMSHQGEVIGASFFANDISRRMEAQKALKENEAHLKELNITKDKFFSIIAHDLKSPFNSIVGLSDLLVKEAKGFDKVEQISKIIQKSSHQAMDLLANLLEWARSQSGKIDFSPEFFEVNAVINHEIENLKSQAKQKHISINNTVPTQTIVYADRNMLASIIRNLISNAIKYSFADSKVDIIYHLKNSNSIFTVKDYGTGIEPSILNHLFDIDKNNTTPGTNYEHGTGLGLILCKEFIEKHGGTIHAESIYKEGSEFTFSLPQHSI